MARLPWLPIPLLLLGCAGILSPPDLARLEYRAFSVSILDGEASDEHDFGLRGNVSMSAMGRVQSVTWSRVGTPVEESASTVWDVAKVNLASSIPDLDARVLDTPPPLVERQVNGQHAVGWEKVVEGGGFLAATVWECPKSGVQVTLVTGGLALWSRDLHENALATVACGDEPVPLDDAAMSYTFRGDPTVWTELEADNPDVRLWRTTDGQTVLTLGSDEAIDPGADGGAATCHAVTDAAMLSIGDSYRFPAAAQRTLDLPTGCVRTVEGVSLPDETPTRARFEVRRCDASHGISAFCLTFDPDFALDGCAALFACRAADEAPRRRRKGEAAE